MKVLFLQDFSLAGKGGGASIIKRLIAYGANYHVETVVAFDRHSNNGIAHIPGEKSFFTLPRTMRFGFGRLAGCLTIFGIDIFSFFSIRKLIRQVNPDVIHVVAHGISFPLLVLAAKKSGKKVVVSVHDLWHWTVSGYISKKMADHVFKKSVRGIDTVYVISGEMEHYLAEQCGSKNYLVIHDGITGSLPYVDKPVKAGFVNILYVGILHAMQVKQFNKLLAVLAETPACQFTIGVCSATVFQPARQYDNVSVVNYGWLKEEEVKAISLQYEYGLLPLSFEEADLLFYQTSLMTKIPFYTSVLLPIICIGHGTASAVRLILREGTGLVATEKDGSDLPALVKNMAGMNAALYTAYIQQLKKSAASSFNFDLIAERFYSGFSVN